MLRRNLTHHLREVLTDTPVALVNDARQTGKTTLVQSTELAGPDLDEVQDVPELFPAIKVAVDRKREPGRFLLTGSADVLFLPRLSESLADRLR